MSKLDLEYLPTREDIWEIVDEEEPRKDKLGRKIRYFVIKCTICNKYRSVPYNIAIRENLRCTDECHKKHELMLERVRKIVEHMASESKNNFHEAFEKNGLEYAITKKYTMLLASKITNPIEVDPTSKRLYRDNDENTLIAIDLNITKEKEDYVSVTDNPVVSSGKQKKTELRMYQSRRFTINTLFNALIKMMQLAVSDITTMLNDNLIKSIMIASEGNIISKHSIAIIPSEKDVIIIPEEMSEHFRTAYLGIRYVVCKKNNGNYDYTIVGNDLYDKAFSDGRIYIIRDADNTFEHYKYYKGLDILSMPMLEKLITPSNDGYYYMYSSIDGALIKKPKNVYVAYIGE